MKLIFMSFSFMLLITSISPSKKTLRHLTISTIGISSALPAMYYLMGK